MGFLNPDLDDRDELIKAHKSGVMIALIFAGMNLLGATLIWFSGTLPSGTDNPIVTPDEKLSSMVGVGLVVLIALIVAWRFHIGKGAIAGAILMIILAIELLLKLTSLSIGGVILTAFLLLSMANATRAAFRRRGHSPDVGTTFE